MGKKAPPKPPEPKVSKWTRVIGKGNGNVPKIDRTDRGKDK